MAGSQRTIRAERLRAEAAVERAMSGDLVKLRSYNLIRDSDGRYTIGVPPQFPQNTAVSKGDGGQVFVDFQEGIAVYDFGGSITEGGDEQE